MNIPGYQLGRQVAAGKFCTTYNALNIANSKTVTVQVLKQELIADKELNEQLQIAIKKLSGYAFGIMTPIKRAQLAESGSHLICEYFPSPEQREETLPELPLQTILDFGQRLAATLTLLHKTGLPHGGIELSSVFFPRPDEVALAPVALQRVLPTLQTATLSELNHEQLIYLAPEADRGLNAATDFYALGVVLYQLIFHRPPFVGDTAEQIRQQKTAINPVLVDPNHQYLLPFFNHLLAADPHQRICKASQFEQALHECGVHIASPNYTKQAVEADDRTEQPMLSGRLALGPGLTTRKSLIALAGLVLLTAIPVYFLLQDTPTVTPSQPLRPLVVVEPAPASVGSKTQPQHTEQALPAAEQNNAIASQQVVDELVQQARQRMAANNFGSALLVINQALKEIPAHPAATQIKQAIEMEIEARSILSRAEQQLADLKLTRPLGDNALESYQTLQRLLPQQDRRAHSGYEKIVAYYLGMADKAKQSGDHQLALRYVADGLEVSADHPSLLDLQAEISAQQVQLAQQQDQQRRAQQERLRQQQINARIERERKQAELEQQRLAAEKEAERLQQQQIRQQRVNQLLASASEQLRRGSLSLARIDTAKVDYQQLRALGENGERVDGLRQDIIDAYGMLANTQKNARQYGRALQTLEQAFRMETQDPNLVQIRQEVQALQARQQQAIRQQQELERQQDAPQSPQQVPIIGTF